MSIVSEEIFGPVLCVQRFKTDAEAISLAKATAYGGLHILVNNAEIVGATDLMSPEDTRLSDW